MPRELELRGVSDASSVCNSVLDDLGDVELSNDDAPSNDVDAIFSRLAEG